MVYQEVNGGFLHVDAGSMAHFLGNLEVNDFFHDVFDGGCGWNNIRRMFLISMHKRRAVEIV